MKKHLTRRPLGSLLAAMVSVIAVAAAARADTWQIDPAHTSVEFSVRHMMVSNVRGHFGKVSGSITSKGKDPDSVKIKAKIDASSIDTGIEKRDNHLKSADFLDAEQFPNITFESKKIESAGTGKWKVTGDLTLHGVTKEVVLDVEGPAEAITDPSGKLRAGASATTTINRKDFGVAWNKTLDAGGVMVGEEVKISIEVEATKQGGGSAEGG